MDRYFENGQEIEDWRLDAVNLTQRELQKFLQDAQVAIGSANAITWTAQALDVQFKGKTRQFPGLSLWKLNLERPQTHFLLASARALPRRSEDFINVPIVSLGLVSAQEAHRGWDGMFLWSAHMTLDELVQLVPACQLWRRGPILQERATIAIAAAHPGGCILYTFGSKGCSGHCVYARPGHRRLELGGRPAHATRASQISHSCIDTV
jgi:hypothetical protein